MTTSRVMPSSWQSYREQHFAPFFDSARDVVHRCDQRNAFAQRPSVSPAARGSASATNARLSFSGSIS